MKKIIISLMLICTLLCSTTVFATGNIMAITLSLKSDGTSTPAVFQQTVETALFSDTNINDWYYPHMQMLVEKGGINGYEDGTFKPNNIITNAEFVKIIVGLVIKGGITAGNIHWADVYVQKARELGIVEADELPADEYDEPIRRQRMAKFAARTMEKVLKETPTANTADYISKITDWADVCESCKPYVAEVYSKGVICGMPNGSFSGGSNAIRAEATTMLVRMIDPSYRVTLYSNIPYNQITDTMTDGRMTATKSQNFMDYTLEHLKFYKENGKYYVSGSFPELPDEYENQLDVSVTMKNAPIVNVTTGFTMFDENKIENTGSFTKELTGISNVNDIDFLEIFISVNALEHSNDTGYKYGFSGNYRITTAKNNIVTYSKYNGDNFETFEYDFSKIFKW